MADCWIWDLAGLDWTRFFGFLSICLSIYLAFNPTWLRRAIPSYFPVSISVDVFLAMRACA
jgi:hypothetical protein